MSLTGEGSAVITPREFWNLRSATYDLDSGAEYAAAYEKTAANALKYLSEDARVLEFACGTGITTAAIAPHVSFVRAIDISEKMVEKCGERIRGLGLSNVELSRTDLFDPCLEEGGFDAVTAFNVLLYVKNRGEVLERIWALLKPGGVFLSATDCLGEKVTKVGLRKFWKSHTGSMPYVAFDTRAKLERDIARAGFDVLERENLFPAPPNLFVAARKR